MINAILMQSSTEKQVATKLRTFELYRNVTQVNRSLNILVLRTIVQN